MMDWWEIDWYKLNDWWEEHNRWWIHRNLLVICPLDFWGDLPMGLYWWFTYHGEIIGDHETYPCWFLLKKHGNLCWWLLIWCFYLHHLTTTWIWMELFSIFGKPAWGILGSLTCLKGLEVTEVESTLSGSGQVCMSECWNWQERMYLGFVNLELLTEIKQKHIYEKFRNEHVMPLHFGWWPPISIHKPRWILINLAKLGTPSWKPEEKLKHCWWKLSVQNPSLIPLNPGWYIRISLFDYSNPQYIG